MSTYNPDQSSASDDQFLERIQRIEAQLALLSGALGVPFGAAADALPPEVVSLARAGDRPGAIGRYRELTGAGADEPATPWRGV